MMSQMQKVGEKEDINFSYGGFIGNTLHSHRLIWKARELGGSELQDSMVESLFKAYFEEEKSLGEKEVLKECALRAGFPEDVIETLLDTEEGIVEVKREETEYRSRWRCSGVPLFVIDGRISLSGAQTKETFLDAFEELDE